MKKTLVRGLVVLTSFVLVFALICRSFLLKSEDGIEQMRSFYLQDENTVDVLFVGNSQMYCNINTGILWQEYGMSAFNLGGAEQPYWNSYYYIKEALKTQTPKAIVLSITTPAMRTEDYQPENWVVTNLYGMKWNKNRIEATRASTLKDSFNRLLFPIYTMHSRYTDLSRDDFIDSNYSKSNKGYDLRATIVPFERPDIAGVTDTVPITEKQETYLRKIIELTKESDTPLVLAAAPYIIDAEQQKKVNYQIAIAEEMDVDYIDFNKLYDEIGLDFANDMAEDLHLNIYGGEKFTKYIGKCLKDKYDIADHRGDSRYTSWEKDAFVHQQELAGVELDYTTDIEKYIAGIMNDNYISYIVMGKGFSGDSGNTVYSELKSRVANVSDICPNAVTILNGKNLVFYSCNNQFSSFIDEGYDKLMLRRTCDEYDNFETKYYLNETEYSLGDSDMMIIVYDRSLDKIVSFTKWNMDGDSNWNRL